MTSLGEWLKQLVLIVLFAVFAELLLPTKALERYVRMVLGLALIATMIQPFGVLITKNWGSQLAQEAVAELTRNSTTGSMFGNSTSNTKTLEKYFHQDQAAQADTLLANRLRSAIADKFNLTPQRVIVTNAQQPAQLSVHIILSQMQMSRASPIANWTAEQLGLNRSRVTIGSVGGGDSNGSEANYAK
ncbi:stage III sporulation protein AF [Alicyclobacillus sp. SO9]|uniref:stage III sporulation protein AF n=1 Tax=Alicyclobacillus sp. SO9 TaxID=2665646 RepID=UPI0018E81BAB|nr:stage III sporulation protein AF [Alicyclobacillus sp. SO9]QQE76977.1 stage III sporulation protein AF [Alicyclobacillus sp. SO9]